MSRSYTWWGIALGLVIEFVALRLLVSLPIKKAMIAVFWVNAATALVGCLTIPILTFAWDYILSHTIYQFLDLGTFNPLEWVSTILLMGLICGFPEYLLLRYAFKLEFAKKKRPFT